MGEIVDKLDGMPRFRRQRNGSALIDHRHLRTDLDSAGIKIIEGRAIGLQNLIDLHDGGFSFLSRGEVDGAGSQVELHRGRAQLCQAWDGVAEW